MVPAVHCCCAHHHHHQLALTHHTLCLLLLRLLRRGGGGGGGGCVAQGQGRTAPQQDCVCGIKEGSDRGRESDKAHSCGECRHID